MRQGVEAFGDPAGPILQLSDETYYRPRGALGQHAEHALPELRTEVETLLRQRMQGQRKLPAALRGGRAGRAFVDKPLCVARLLAEAVANQHVQNSEGILPEKLQRLCKRKWATHYGRHYHLKNCKWLLK